MHVVEAIRLVTLGKQNRKDGILNVNMTTPKQRDTRESKSIDEYYIYNSSPWNLS
jgi:hypothetical protein